MTPGPKLEPPAIRLEQVEDLTPPQPPGFLRLVRPRWVAHYPDGSVSQPFVYDEVDRAAIDAVVIAAHFSEGGHHHVYLRSAVRPPVARREAPGQPHGLWELPAGLVEPSEAGIDGARRTAQRELEEELGFTQPLERLLPLGHWMLPAPGIIAERHYYFAALVEPGTRVEPSLDGSPLEHFGMVVALELDAALALCGSGEICDAKTELGLRRLKERLG
jgi:ADP-ribose pyrophosphatase